MRYLAIGDVHGCLHALHTLLDLVQPQSHDVLVMLGDYVDRGPDSRGVVQWLLQRKQQTVPPLIALRGNHEIMMLDARENDRIVTGWLGCGGEATLQSYSSDGAAGQLADVPESHWDMLESTLPYFETQRHIFVHANLYPDAPLDEQPDYILYWEPFEQPTPHYSGKVMVCGHTSQKTGEPLSVGHAVCIDTWVYGRGWLTCLDADTGQYWQANEQGETRQAWLDPAPRGRAWDG